MSGPDPETLVLVNVRAFKEAVWAVERANFRPGNALDALDRATVPDRGEMVERAAVEKLLSEVSSDYAGAHVNAGVVVGTVRKRLRALGPATDQEQEGTDG